MRKIFPIDIASWLNTLVLGICGVAFVSLILVGCYTFSGTTLPAHLRTLRIKPIENKTLESSLPDRIAQGLEEGFRQRTSLRRVNEGGDAELVSVLKSYSHRPQSVSGDKVTSYRVDILMGVVFLDRVKGDTIYKDDQVQGYGAYQIEIGQTEETGQKLAVENLVKVVLDHTVSGW